MAGEAVVRGPGNGGTGYCALQSSAATATSQKLTLRASTRAASVVPVEVVYNPSSLLVTTPSGLVVPGGDYDVHTSYAAATLTPGSPVTCTVAASSSGAAENQPVTVGK